MKRAPISKQIQLEIFLRDKWMCRYCGEEVLFSPALKVLDEQVPDKGYYHRNGRANKMSPMLLNKSGAIDHIHPVSDGGGNEFDNLVSSCWKCNSSKSNDLSPNWINKIIPIEELKPAEGWDGMFGLIERFDKSNEWIKVKTNIKRQTNTSTVK